MFACGVAVALSGCVSPVTQAARQCEQVFEPQSEQYYACVQQRMGEIDAARQSAYGAMMSQGFQMANPPRPTFIIPPSYGPAYGPPPAPGIIWQP